MKVTSKIRKTSRGRDKKVYCEAGDVLDVVEDYGDILIVIKHERFSIRKDECHEIDK